MTVTRSRVDQLRKDHERKMVLRIVFFVLLMLVMLILLARYAIPGFVSIANIWLQVKESDQTATPQTQLIPLSPPSLDRPSREVTKENKLGFKGSTEAGSKVFLMVNEQPAGDAISSSDGSFEFNDVELKEGDNLIYVYREDDKGNKSDPSRSTTVVLDTQAPTIKVEKPFSGESFKGQSQRTIDVNGSSSGADYVYVNESRVILNDEGTFSQRVRLETGENAIKVKAIDEAGNESVEVTRTVRWEE